VQTAETVLKRGIDLYAEGNNRLLAGAKYWANYNL